MRTPTSVISMISGLADVSLSPKTIYVYLWRHQDTQNNRRKVQLMFENSVLEIRDLAILKMLEMCVPHMLKVWNLKN